MTADHSQILLRDTFQGRGLTQTVECLTTLMDSPIIRNVRKVFRPLIAQLVAWLVFNGTFSTKRLYCAMRKLKVCF